MLQFTFSSQEIENLIRTYDHPPLQETLRLYTLYGDSNIIPLQLHQSRLIADNLLPIGYADVNKSTASISPPDTSYRLLSLNVGGFGVDSNSYDHLDTTTQQNYFLPRLHSYIQAGNFDIIHLQDFPHNHNYIESLAQCHNYQFVFIPQIFLKHRFYKSQDSGLLVLAKQHISIQNIRILFHPTRIPKVSNYTKKLRDNDMIILNSTVLYDIASGQKNSITCGNTYISPISRTRERIMSVLESIPSNLDNPYVLTGDINIYGINSLHLPFKIPINPYGFLLNAASVLTCRYNIPHFFERSKLHTLLQQQELRIANLDTFYQPTISIPLHTHIPSVVKPLFKHVSVSWLLDVAITNINTLYTRIDNNPFGDIDHASLIVMFRK